MRKYWTYIATNQGNTVLYTGVTNNIARRMFEHKNKLVEGFTSKYNVNKLVWCEAFGTFMEAATAEKKIKGWVRARKIALIKSINPEFKDLSVG
jgi:putative endonuclease